MEHLFEEYKKIRIEKKITLEQISRKTRISKEYLEKIEQGDLEFLPYPYVKGFIKVYAKYIGIELQELEKKYDELGRMEKKVLKEDEIKKEAEKKESFVVKESLTRLKEKRKVILFSILGICTAVLFYIIGSFIINSQKSGIKPLSRETFDEIIVSLPDTARESIKRREVFKVEIIAEEETWMRVNSDDTEDKEYILKPGESISIDAYDRVTMRTGKSQGVDILLNGKSLGVLGSANTLLWELVVTGKGIQKKQLKMRTDADSLGYNR